MALKHLDILRQKTKQNKTKKPHKPPALSLTHYTNINFKWITDSNINHKTIKSLGKKKQENLQEVRLG